MKKRVDYLPAIGQALMKGMAAEAVAAIKAGKGLPSYCLEGLFRLANVPMDFQRRWSSERAIQDAMLKARDFGFVDKHCGGNWYYRGPEVGAAEKDIKVRRARVMKEATAFLKKAGLEVDDVRVSSRSQKSGRVSARVYLPARFKC